MASQGAKQVPLIALDDKREITVLLSVTLSGKMLPPQLIYSGTTERVHPNTAFPAGWDIWHSKSHWSTAETMDRFVDKILLPYIESTKQKLKLENSQKSICLFDVFAAHRTAAFLDKLKANHILPIFIPASCTSELQPLDISVNEQFKRCMKEQCATWYSDTVFNSLAKNQGGAVEKVNLNLSILKPLHAEWLINAISTIQTDSKLIKSGFTQAGIAVNLDKSDDAVSEYEADTEPYESSDNDISISMNISQSKVVVATKPTGDPIVDVMNSILDQIE